MNQVVLNGFDDNTAAKEGDKHWSEISKDNSLILDLRKNGGGSGQRLIFKRPGGDTVRVCTKHDSFADGHEFVGVSIQPGIPVHLTRADIIAGWDSVLETAIHSLQNKP